MQYYPIIHAAFLLIAVAAIVIKRKGWISISTMMLISTGCFIAIGITSLIKGSWFFAAFHFALASSLGYMEYQRWKVQKALEEWRKSTDALNEKLAQFDEELAQYRAKREASRSEFTFIEFEPGQKE